MKSEQKGNDPAEVPKHRWKLSWPGNFCLDCGIDDPFESQEALIDCPDCEKGCDKCRGTGCIPNPNLVMPPCK